MIRLLLALLLTPQADLPFMDSLPLDYPGRFMDGCWCDRGEVIAHYQRACWRENEADQFEYARRESTRLFLLELTLFDECSGPDDVRYIWGRMIGRQPLWTYWTDGESYLGPDWLDQLGPNAPEPCP